MGCENVKLFLREPLAPERATCQLAELHVSAGDLEAARRHLEEALELARSEDLSGVTALACSVLTCLPGADTQALLSAISAEGRAAEEPRVQWYLWQATRDLCYLREARRLLEQRLERNPIEVHANLRNRVGVHRQILAACREEFGTEDPDWASTDSL